MTCGTFGLPFWKNAFSQNTSLQLAGTVSWIWFLTQPCPCLYVRLCRNLHQEKQSVERSRWGGACCTPICSGGFGNLQVGPEASLTWDTGGTWLYGEEQHFTQQGTSGSCHTDSVPVKLVPWKYIRHSLVDSVSVKTKLSKGNNADNWLKRSAISENMSWYYWWVACFFCVTRQFSALQVTALETIPELHIWNLLNPGNPSGKAIKGLNL